MAAPGLVTLPGAASDRHGRPVRGRPTRDPHLRAEPRARGRAGAALRSLRPSRRSTPVPWRRRRCSTERASRRPDRPPLLLGRRALRALRLPLLRRARARRARGPRAPPSDGRRGRARRARSPTRCPSPRPADARAGIGNTVHAALEWSAANALGEPPATSCSARWSRARDLATTPRRCAARAAGRRLARTRDAARRARRAPASQRRRSRSCSASAAR